MDKMKVEDVVQALAWEMNTYTDSAASEELAADGCDLDITVREYEEEMDRKIGAIADRETAFSLQEGVMLLEGAAMMQGYEHGIRYGARLMWQMLTGETGAELDTRVQAIIKGLAVNPDVRRDWRRGGTKDAARA